jgi:hypothetical protein
MAAVTPSPQTWTFRLKSHKTTVLLHVDPLSTFSNIKELLYTALKESHLKDENGVEIPLPPSPSDIQLGRPVSINDPQSGFMLGEWEEQDVEGADDAEENSKGKGKQNGDAKPFDALKQCPKGAGLRDNAVLAFRFKGDATAWGNDGVAMADDEPDMWGVKIASYEDSYGVDNQGDVGGHRESDE